MTDLDNLANRIVKIKDVFSERKHEYKITSDSLVSTKEQINLLSLEVQNLIKARWVIAEVAKLTQENFTSYIEELMTSAIRSVYQKEWKFKVQFDIRRNKSECILSIEEPDGTTFSPRGEEGGGLLDVCSVAFKVIMWSISPDSIQNVLILDEPMKFLGSGEMANRGLQMIKEISHKLGLQFIITTHLREEFASIADKAWIVTSDGILSKVEELFSTSTKQTEKPKSKLIRRKS